MDEERFKKTLVYVAKLLFSCSILLIFYRAVIGFFLNGNNVC